MNGLPPRILPSSVMESPGSIINFDKLSKNAVDGKHQVLKIKTRITVQSLIGSESACFIG